MPLVRTLCCEGICSGTYQSREHLRRTFGRGKGYTPSQTRAVESNSLRHTSHVESQRDVKGEEIRVYYRCLVCGHERLFGAEEPRMAMAEPESPLPPPGSADRQTS